MNSAQNTAIFTPQKGWRSSTFGVLLDERSKNGGEYRYGFNGMEKDDAISGSGNSYNFGARMLNPRVGRWFVCDPLASRYPEYTTYSFVNNGTILNVDPDGRKIRPTNSDATILIDLMLKPFERIIMFEVSVNGTISTQSEFTSFKKFKKAFKKANKQAVKRGDAKLPKEQLKEGWALYLAVSDPKIIEIQATTAGAAPVEFTYDNNEQSTGSMVVQGNPLTKNDEQEELYYILRQNGVMTDEISRGLYQGDDVPYEQESEEGTTETINVQITPDIRKPGYVFFKDEKFVQKEKGQIFVDITGKSIKEMKNIIVKALEDVTTP